MNLGIKSDKKLEALKEEKENSDRKEKLRKQDEAYDKQKRHLQAVNQAL